MLLLIYLFYYGLYKYLLKVKFCLEDEYLSYSARRNLRHRRPCDAHAMVQLLTGEVISSSLESRLVPHQHYYLRL
jgi:hypothetical protein